MGKRCLHWSCITNPSIYNNPRASWDITPPYGYQWSVGLIIWVILHPVIIWVWSDPSLCENLSPVTALGISWRKELNVLYLWEWLQMSNLWSFEGGAYALWSPLTPVSLLIVGGHFPYLISSTVFPLFQWCHPVVSTSNYRDQSMDSIFFVSPMCFCIHYSFIFRSSHWWIIQFFLLIWGIWICISIFITYTVSYNFSDCSF